MRQQATPTGRVGDGTRVLQLDAVRGLSILLVMVAHAALRPELHSFLYFPLTAMNRVGFSGVDVFFVLSGFLVGGLLIGEFQKTSTITPSRFFVRRAFKVWPTYYAFLIAYAIAIVAGGHEGTMGSRASSLFAHQWPNLLHVQNYFARSRPLGLFWSLAVEEHFYLVLPWALIFIFGLRRGPDSAAPNIGKRMTATFAAVAMVCLLLRWWTARIYGPMLEGANPDYDLVAYRTCFATHLRIDSLFAGVYVAYLVRFRGPLVERLRPFRHAILGVSLLTWVPFYSRAAATPEALVLGRAALYLAAGGLVMSAHLAATAPAPRSHGWLKLPMQVLGWLGVRSYAIYVWHGYFSKPVGVRVVRLLHLSGAVPGLEGWAHDLIMLAADALVGALMYELVELPGLRLRQKVAPAIVPTPTDTAPGHGDAPEPLLNS
jgi:peptidoglycan/LPS O-acetylase OafA/YrhL